MIYLNWFIRDKSSVECSGGLEKGLLRGNVLESLLRPQIGVTFVPPQRHFRDDDGGADVISEK